MEVRATHASMCIHKQHTYTRAHKNTNTINAESLGKVRTICFQIGYGHSKFNTSIAIHDPLRARVRDKGNETNERDLIVRFRGRK